MIPAPIRTKNPGAMWGHIGRKPDAFYPLPEGPHGCETNAPIPLKWGSTRTIYLSDGLGQDNNAAIFDTWVQGICAQIELWRTKYRNQTFANAIAVWSGGNNVEDYIAFVLKRVPGMTRDTVMDDEFWRGPMATDFLKAQAWHEAGQPCPAPDEDFVEARRRALAAPRPVKPKTHVAAASTGGAIVAAPVTAAMHAGLAPVQILFIAAAAIAVAAIVASIIYRNRS